VSSAVTIRAFVLTVLVFATVAALVVVVRDRSPSGKRPTDARPAAIHGEAAQSPT
jgi:hypothetical protein